VAEEDNLSQEELEKLIDKKVEEKLKEKENSSHTAQDVDPEKIAEDVSSSQLSRRKFLKLLGIGTAGTALASSAAGASLLSGTTIGGNTVWHAGNDGKNSGLVADSAGDADTVDGSHASGFTSQTELNNHAGDGDAHHTYPVPTGGLADQAVSTPKLALGAVDTSQIAGDAVTGAEVASGAIGTDQIAAGGVDTTQIANNAVTEAETNFSIPTSTQDTQIKPGYNTLGYDWSDGDTSTRKSLGWDPGPFTQNIPDGDEPASDEVRVYCKDRSNYFSLDEVIVKMEDGSSYSNTSPTLDEWSYVSHPTKIVNEIEFHTSLSSGTDEFFLYEAQFHQDGVRRHSHSI